MEGGWVDGGRREGGKEGDERREVETSDRINPHRRVLAPKIWTSTAKHLASLLAWQHLLTRLDLMWPLM